MVGRADVNRQQQAKTRRRDVIWSSIMIGALQAGRHRIVGQGVRPMSLYRRPLVENVELTAFRSTRQSAIFVHRTHEYILYMIPCYVQ